MGSDEHACLDSEVVWFAGSLTGASTRGWFLLSEHKGFVVSLRETGAVEVDIGIVSDWWVTFLVIDL